MSTPRLLRSVKGLTAAALLGTLVATGAVVPAPALPTTLAGLVPAASEHTAAEVTLLAHRAGQARRDADTAARASNAADAAASAARAAADQAGSRARQAATATAGARRALSVASRFRAAAARSALRKARAAQATAARAAASTRTAATRAATRAATARENAAAAETAAVRAASALAAAADEAGVPASAEVPEGQRQLRELAAGSGRELLGTLVDRQRAGTATALWQDPTGTCRRCLTGPALAAASLAARTGDPWFTDVAVRTFDEIIADGLDPSGGLRPYGSTAPNDIETAFFGGAIGLATVQLGDRLDPAHRQRYTEVVAGTARWLNRNGNYAWYTNGNVSLGNAVPALAAYRLTADPQYLAMYDRAIAFVVSPTRPRWAGRGLVVTSQPSFRDGSDGRAYFTEESPGAPGWDPEYSMLQLDMLMRLDQLDAGPEVRRLLNMVYNQQAQRIDTTRWTMDLSNGSRHPQPNRIWGMQTVVVGYLAYHGRPELEPLALANAQAVVTEVTKNLPYYGTQPGLQFAYGSIFSAMAS